MKDDDFKLLRGFIDGQTNGRTNKWTFVNVESLSRLIILKYSIVVGILKVHEEIANSSSKS